MGEIFQLEAYLSNGIENLIKGAVKATLKNPRESAFIARYAMESKKSRKIREGYEAKGIHIPPFLIASITSNCNLHCTGCYARANHSCKDQEDKEQLTVKQWDAVFKEAQELGVAFILLAGGEPMMRPEILRAASGYKSILFPVFTNGTLQEEKYIDLFHQNRNLIPVVSLEGDENTTDLRRGEGVYKKIIYGMEQLQNKGIFYGTSVTVNRKNLREVTSGLFLENLSGRECKLVFYIEYVPVTKDTSDLAFTENERLFLEEKLADLRRQYKEILFISFPGDEKSSGGCLAAGRGFFHINPHGGAEPCPFSPYSDTDLKKGSIYQALSSPLFQKLKEDQILQKEHTGGCVLFEQKEIVETYLKDVNNSPDNEI